MQRQNVPSGDCSKRQNVGSKRMELLPSLRGANRLRQYANCDSYGGEAGMIREYVVQVTDSVIPDAFQRFENELSPEQELVRCKDCIHRENSKKCILAAVAKTKNCPVFLFDNSGEWFCADGKRGDVR